MNFIKNLNINLSLQKKKKKTLIVKKTNSLKKERERGTW